MATLTINPETLTANTYTHLEEVSDLIKAKTDILSELEAKADPLEGGHNVITRIKKKRHSSITRFQTGFEDIDLTTFEQHDFGTEDWFDIVIPAVISGQTKRKNRGPTKILELGPTRAADALQNGREKLEEHLLAGGVTGLEDMNSFNGVDHSYGFFEEQAVGSQTNTVCGLSKSTLSALRGWQNGVIDGAAAFASNGIIRMIREKIALDTKTPGMNGTPDHMVILSQLCAENLTRTVLAKEHYVGEKSDVDSTRTHFIVWGKRGIVSEFMPDSGTTTATYKVGLYIVDKNSILLRPNKGYWFQATDWMQVDRKDVYYMRYHVMGQLMAKYLRSSAIGVRLDTW